MKLPVRPSLPVMTPRLVLRGFAESDLEALLSFHSDPDAVRFVPYPPRDRDTMIDVLRRKIGNTELREVDDRLELAVTRRGDDTVLGDVLLALRSAEHETLEVGYIFSPASAGQGYATEAVRALLDLAFGAFGARRVVARVDARNSASLALLDRVGLRREAYLVENEWFKGELTSEVDYAILAREWPGELDRRLAQAITELLATRRPGATICPSDAARAVSPDGWRDLMEPARRAASRLVGEGVVVITQGGQVVEPLSASGPIRIRLAR